MDIIKQDTRTYVTPASTVMSHNNGVYKEASIDRITGSIGVHAIPNISVIKFGTTETNRAIEDMIISKLSILDIDTSLDSSNMNFVVMNFDTRSINKNKKLDIFSLTNPVFRIINNLSNNTNGYYFDISTDLSVTNNILIRVNSRECDRVLLSYLRILMTKYIFGDNDIKTGIRKQLYDKYKDKCKYAEIGLKLSLLITGKLNNTNNIINKTIDVLEPVIIDNPTTIDLSKYTKEFKEVNNITVRISELDTTYFYILKNLDSDTLNDDIPSNNNLKALIKSSILNDYHKPIIDSIDIMGFTNKLNRIVSSVGSYTLINSYNSFIRNFTSINTIGGGESIYIKESLNNFHIEGNIWGLLMRDVKGNTQINKYPDCDDCYNNIANMIYNNGTIKYSKI